MEGTFNCPICGKDSPHGHTSEEIISHTNQQKIAAANQHDRHVAIERLEDIRELIRDGGHAVHFRTTHEYRQRLVLVIDRSIMEVRAGLDSGEVVSS